MQIHTSRACNAFLALLKCFKYLNGTMAATTTAIRARKKPTYRVFLFLFKTLLLALSLSLSFPPAMLPYQCFSWFRSSFSEPLRLLFLRPPIKGVYGLSLQARVLRRCSCNGLSSWAVRLPLKCPPDQRQASHFSQGVSRLDWIESVLIIHSV